MNVIKLKVDMERLLGNYDLGVKAIRLVLDSGIKPNTLPRNNNCPLCTFYTNDTGPDDDCFVEYCFLGGNGFGRDCPQEKLDGEVR